MQQLDLSSLSASTAEPSSVLPSSPTTEAGHLDDLLGPLGSTKVRYEDSLRSVKDSQRSTMASPRSIMDVTMQQRQRPEPADRPETRTTGFLLKKASQFPYNWKERFCVFDKDRHELAWYASERDYNSGAKPRGQLRVTSTREQGESLTFQAHHSSTRQGGALLAKVESARERSRWVAAVRESLHQQQKLELDCPVLGPLASPRL